MSILKDSAVQVRIEPTPNPATMTFRFTLQNSPDLDAVFTEGPLSFPNSQEAEASPLASKIFGFPWTNSVLLGRDFISISKQDWVDWEVLAEPLADLIRDHLAQGLPLTLPLETTAGADDVEDISSEDSPIIQQIKRTLNQEIRPVVAYDGGDVRFGKYEGGKLYLQFRGACAGCPSKSVTLKEGIEVRLKELYPEIQEVIGL